MSVSKEDAILYDEIMTLYNVIIGYVAAIEYNNIIVISKGTKQEYKFPKSMIVRLNDNEILLDIMSGELNSYMVN
jgi:arginine exporter protein ArgO